MDAKIRSAVEEVTKIMPYLKGDGNEPHYKALIDLANDYLACGEKLPEAKKVFTDDLDDIEEKEIFNQARHECILVSLKQQEKLLEALELILPLAKGYVANHKVGSNEDYISFAEDTIHDSVVGEQK